MENSKCSYTLPKYRIHEIMKLYESCKHTLGTESRIRRRAFSKLLQVYYKWETKSNIQKIFDKYVKPREIEYMTKFRAKNIKTEYGELVKRLFGSIDNNDDGCIDLDEFKYAVRKLDNIDSDDLFEKADTNNDGVLDTNEFYKLVASEPILRNNFDLIMDSAVNENNRKEYERKSRIFKNDISGRRPSLSDLKSSQEICNSDIPLYGVELLDSESETTRRRFGF